MASLTIAEGEVKEVEILVKMKEPRGIDVKEGDFTFSSEAHVYVVSDDDVKVINEEWFSYIHTVNFSPWDDRKILVSSSGYDCIFEFDLQSGLKSFEWFAWEHGFSRGINSVNGKAFQLTRNKDQAD
ncbi:MAG: hypothetical protein JKY18_12755, partial [Flavobacteriales bacterium]|nr:hypothetical protein [Flavobacteriales bacterium]